MKNRSLLAITTLLVSISICSVVFSQGSYHLAIRGQKMTLEQAKALEQRLEQDPNDAVARSLLLGYYFGKQDKDPSARKAKQKHLLWFIENTPQSKILSGSSPFAQLDIHLDAEAYSRGKKAWKDHLEKNPNNLALLEGASGYFIKHDQNLAREILEKGQSLDNKNPKWPLALGLMYSQEMKTDSLKKRRIAGKKALEQLELADKLMIPALRETNLIDLAKAAVAAQETTKAKKYAEKLLNLKGTEWSAGNFIHHGNITLGKIAYDAGDLEAAKQHLIKAGKVPGTPALSTIGPDMTLAKDLLQKGEKEVVLEYLTLCSQIWRLGKDRLVKWTEIVKNDQIPKSW